MLGSSPRCALRIVEPEIAPVHCLFDNSDDSLTARSWGAATSRNGESFEETSLWPGDVLSFGGLELQVLNRDDSEAQAALAQQQAEEAAAGIGVAHDRAAWSSERYGLTSAWAKSCGDRGARASAGTPAVGGATVSAAAAAEVFRQLQSANEVARGRSRKLIASLRENRGDYQALCTRIDELEQALREALTERCPADPEQNSAACSEVEPGDGAGTTAESSEAAPNVVTAEQWAELVAANKRCAEEIGQVAGAQTRIIDEVVDLTRETCELTNRLNQIDQLLGEWNGDISRLRDQFAAWAVQRPEQAESTTMIPDDAAEPLPLVDGPNSFGRKTEPRSSYLSSLDDMEQTDTAPTEHSLADGSEYDFNNSNSTAGDPNGDETCALARDECAGQSNFESSITDIEATATLTAEHAFDAPTPETYAEESRDGDALGDSGGDSDDPSSGTLLWDRVEADRSAGETAELAANDATAGAEPSAKPEFEAPESYIERYARMFEGDDAGAFAKPIERAVQLPVSNGLHFAPLSGDNGSSLHHGAQATSGHEEESIEDYMAKLLKRVRGKSGEESSFTENHGRMIGDHCKAQPLGVAEAAGQTVSSQEYVAPLRDVSEMKRAEPAPEQRVNLAALRELANDSARQAIGLHATRTHRQAAGRKVTIALLAGMTSLMLMVNAPGWSDPQFILACISLMVAAYWAGQSYGDVVQAIRSSSYDATQSKPVEQLPIDVDVATSALLNLPAEPVVEVAGEAASLESANSLDATALESASSPDVVEVAKVVTDSDIVEHSAERAESDSDTVRTAEAAELSSPF